VLRLLLGSLIGQDPATLPLTVGPGGKPQLAAQVSPQFNISHSGALVLLAFHATCPVGVDVERQRADLDWNPIARRCFARRSAGRSRTCRPASKGRPS